MSAAAASASASASALPHSVGYHSFPAASVPSLRARLLSWYDLNRRRLPWRGDAVSASASAADGPGAAASFGAREKKQRTIDSNEQKLKDAIGGGGSSASAAAAASSHSSAGSSAPSVILPVSAYGTWVSEVMLQQTRVETVIGYYMRWMARFPTVASLAAAEEADVMALWAGLGFYRRARFLHAGAKAVVALHKGVMPSTVEGLLSIAGIGDYTAGAVASIAHGICTPLVDGNVIRVLARLRAIDVDPKNRGAQAVFWSLARMVVDPQRPGDFNQALMELGATVCTPSSPRCGDCPVRSQCKAHAEVSQRKRPCDMDMDEMVAEDAVGASAASAAATSVPSPIVVIDIEDLEAAPAAVAAASSAASSSKAKKSKPPPADPFAHPEASCAICDPRAAVPAAVTEYPSKAVKKPPLEQSVAVCVLRRPAAAAGGEEEDVFLLLRRPPGLLEGQWEFPSVIVPANLTAVQRAAAVVDFLAAQFAVLSPTLSSVLTPPTPLGSLVHIFSHRKHLMDVSLRTIDLSSSDELRRLADDRTVVDTAAASSASSKKPKAKAKAKKPAASAAASKKRKNADEDDESGDEEDADDAAESAESPAPRSYRWVTLAQLQQDHQASEGSELGLSTGVRKVVKLVTEEGKGGGKSRADAAKPRKRASKKNDAAESSAAMEVDESKEGDASDASAIREVMELDEDEDEAAAAPTVASRNSTPKAKRAASATKRSAKKEASAADAKKQPSVLSFFGAKPKPPAAEESKDNSEP